MIDHDEILDSIPEQKNLRRRKLIPKWIIVFCWIFMIMAVLAFIGAILGLFGFTFQLSLYGLDTIMPLSLTGIVLSVLFLLKGVAGFGLWAEKDWGVEAGLIDAIIGMTVCAYVMVIPFIGKNSSGGFTFRFELFLLIPYFLNLKEISKEWKLRGEGFNDK
jgi:hypothetical protein